MLIMLGSCVPNLRGEGQVEHTQMHLALKTPQSSLQIPLNDLI
jgi:hypothetical protein